MQWNLKICCTVCEIGAKCNLYARNAPTIPTFEYSVLESYSSYPCLLGFDSNLIPNSSIFLYFSHISVRIPNIWDNQRYLCVYMYILLRKSQILGKFISLGLFLLQDTAGSTAFNVEYPNIHFIQTGIPHQMGGFRIS